MVTLSTIVLKQNERSKLNGPVVWHNYIIWVFKDVVTCNKFGEEFCCKNQYKFIDVK
jgi:hypothetical protein